MLITLPGDIVGGVAQAEHRVEQQINIAGAGADDQVDTGHGIAKAAFRLMADLLHTQQYKNTDGNGQKGEQGGALAVPKTA